MGSIEICPFRVSTETFPALMIGNGDITRMSFEPCYKGKCPAFYVNKTEYHYEEHCKRLEK